MENNPYRNVATEEVDVASQAEIDERREFIKKTYLHLTAAIFAFIGVEWFLFEAGFAQDLLQLMVGGPMSWLVVLGLFMGVGWIADWWASRSSNTLLQYAGLGLYVVAQAIIFVPLMYMAFQSSGIMLPGSGVAGMTSVPVLPAAAVTTVSVFSLLTGYVFVTKRDFSFLRMFLVVASALAMGAIVISLLFGFSLGVIFSILMVGLAAGYIVYYTSNVLHHYHTNQHVAAALALFSAVALLFWYILQLFLFASD